MKPIKIFAFTAAIAITALVSAAFINHKTLAPKENVKATGAGFVVVELFTSEGCSSCPPADELVAKIQKEDYNKPVYILAFHVDYWNRLGWKDVFSNADYSKRQNEYARWLNLQSVYTPQIVVNGKKEFVGSQEGTLRNAITEGLRTMAAGTLALSAQREQGSISVQYQTKDVAKNTSLLLALVQKTAQTNVKSGENGGHVLSHVQIVRKLQSQPLDKSGNGAVTIALPDGFNAQGWELVGFIQNTSSGAILAATKYEFSTGVAK
ncbi:hypothetical protein SAMN05216464_104342 [Mucilaginibacter pineti]|uniref:DUF1223 domain-containing protein n=1 Tax=Mucilaginibacter pineti TaxID=1391627 RepID=A0A1G7B0R6_9SPHI|nr:DUF1223 domain-containing protein [Mucilaginibacter pineti]SDE20611.1 hypothetical protein SAMN05216464_104342 [Mucilaginibacter pineti]